MSWNQIHIAFNSVTNRCMSFVPITRRGNTMKLNKIQKEKLKIKFNKKTDDRQQMLK